MQPFSYKKKNKNHDAYYQCIQCQAKIKSKYELSKHLCYAPIPELKPAIANDKLYVYDLEAYQKAVVSSTGRELHQHEINLVCVRSIYSNDFRKCYATIPEFMEELLSNELFNGAILLAHNGGAYDFKFILQYLETNLIP